MKLSSLLDPSLILVNEKAQSQSQIEARLLDRLMPVLTGADRALIEKGLEERAKISSIVVAPGIAFPHARVEGLDDLYVAIACSPEGFEFDGEQVQFVALFLIGGAATNIYLKTMGAMARLLNDASLLEKLSRAANGDSIMQLVEATRIEVEPTVRACDIMEPLGPTLSPTQTAKEAADMFVETGRSVLPVVGEAGDFLGLLPSLNLLRMGLPKYLSEMDNLAFMQNYEPFEDLLKRENEIPVSQLMDGDVKTYMDHTPIIQIANGLVHEQADFAPILNLDGTLVGLISAADFITRVIRA